MEAAVRRVQHGDAPVLKTVRLRSLLDTPSAFGRTHAEEVEYPDDLWEYRVETGSTSDWTATFLAFDEAAQPVGMVGIFRPEDEPATEPDLVSMWVAPDHRGTPLATRLVDAAVDWARSAGYGSVELWVTRGNDRAQRFYERMGFELTGATAPLPSDPCKDEVRMRLAL